MADGSLFFGLDLPSVFPVTDVAAHYEPSTEQDFIDCLGSVEWRLGSGMLYQIMIKGEEGEPATVLPFVPNVPQAELLTSMWPRTLILKARQLGFTTAIALCWTDHAMFNPDQRVGIIAHHQDVAAEFLRDKVLFAYEHMPQPLINAFPLKRRSAKELLWGHNNSSIRVATSMRGGTIHRLHISEMGKIAVQYPRRANEIVTGSLPAVPLNGIAVIESTSEGIGGAFHALATKAEAIHQLGRPLASKEWAFRFYAWWRDPKYRMDPTQVAFTDADHKYFHDIEMKIGRVLDLEQRAWYVSTRENDFSGDDVKMWREYPSIPDECWQKTTEGSFYAPQLATARKQGRIGIVPYVPRIRVNTFWDIGSGDGTGIWLHQLVGAQHRFIGYIENWAQGYSHYVRELRETQYVFGGMFLPHDAMQVRQLQMKVGAPLGMLEELAPDWNWIVVPRVETLEHGITMTREAFPTAWFDEKACKAGLDHLQQYHKKFNARIGMFTDEPEKEDGHSEAADALRQWAQGFEPGLVQPQQRPIRKRLHGLGASVL